MRTDYKERDKALTDNTTRLNTWAGDLSETSLAVLFPPEAWSFYDCIRGKNDIYSFEIV